MEHFAHIFIGKEFAEIVSNIGRQVCKYGGESILSSVNLFVVDDKKVRQLLYSENPITVKDVVLQSPVLQFCWKDLGELTLDFKKDKDLFIREIYDKLLTVANVGVHDLHIMLHFPLYKNEPFNIVKSLYRTAKNSRRPVEIDFIGYCDDFSLIIEPSFKLKSQSKEVLKEYINFREKEQIAFSHFIILQNTSQRGISLGLNTDTLSAVISHFAILCSNSYTEIFPANAEYMDAIAIGISTLHLDKYLYAEYLLGKVMLNAMDHVQLNAKGVDANSAYIIVNQMLADKAGLLSGLFKQIDEQQKHNDDDEFPVMRDMLINEIHIIIERCKKTLNEQNAITMQAAILAVCLAKTDCELFSETIFSQDIVTVDKLFDEPIEYYINNDRAHYYKIAGKDPVNPIQTLKELDTRLINSETIIRNLNRDLENLGKQIDDSNKAPDFYIEDGYVHFKNHKFRLLPSIDQEPLAETYTPKEVNVKSLDMRSLFTPIKNQGQQGSCLSFSLTSIFEYVMKLNASHDFDLSEAFLYYNSRDLDTYDDVNVTTDTGSRFKPSIDSLVKYGIALEKVWPYNDQVYTQKPSEEAYNDAATRKLVSAMNVNLKVNDIKSALVEGCPVAASFTLTPSFFACGRSGGYIPMPSDEEIAAGLNSQSEESKHSRHAMVILGFSDELQMFIVRNSWGLDWGDNGYCYIPYSYIEHKDLFNYACILTEIENLVTKRENITINPLTIDNSDLNIQYAIKNNELYIEERIAEQLRKDKTELRIYLESLKQMYCNPNQRDGFIDVNKKYITAEQDNLEKEIKKKQAELEENNESLNEYKKDFFFRAATFLTSTILLALIYKQFVDILHLSFTNPDYDFTFKPFIAWMIVYAVLVGASIFFRKKTFVKSFWMAGWGLVGVLAAKVIIRLIRYFIGSGMMISYFNPLDIFSKIDLGQWLWLLVVLIAAAIIMLIKSQSHWREWREKRDSIEAEIVKYKKEISAKEREKSLLRLKTFSAWILITKLQEIQTQLYSHYTNLISLINNLRAWYIDMDKKEDEYTLKTPLPDTSLLNPKILDDFFENNIKENPDFHIDFCADISNYHIDMESIGSYKDSLTDRVISLLINRKEFTSFNISEHILINCHKEIAEEINRDMIRNIEEQAGIFLNVECEDRSMIDVFTSIFAPLSDIQLEEFKLQVGNYSDQLIEGSDRYRLTYLKTATVWFRECVNFK